MTRFASAQSIAHDTRTGKRSASATMQAVLNTITRYDTAIGPLPSLFAQ